MECLKKQGYDPDWLDGIKINIPDKRYREETKKEFDRIAKPLDGLGDFENVISRIGAIKKNRDFSLDKKALIVMCSDNGIVEEKVTQSSFEVTMKVAKNILNKRSGVAVMAEKNKVDCFVIDVGINSDEKPSGLIDKKIRKGTRNFRVEPAMTEDEMFKAINTGIETVRELADKGYDIIALGEMGIGNTTTSSAVCASLLQKSAVNVTGRGAGLDDAGLGRKINLIDEAVKKYDLYDKDPLEVLRIAGGYDIASLMGACIGGAIYEIPVVLDGVITQAAGLLAKRVFRETGEYLFASHVGKEKSSELILKELGLKPVIDANMALGEGTGALMYLSLLDNALCVYKNAARFDELEMKDYERF